MTIAEEDYRLAKFCDALSNAVRLELILRLRENERNVSTLAEKLQRDRSSVSRHLGKLADHDLVQSETRGRSNYYKLKRPELIEQFLTLRPYLRRK